MLKHQLIYQGLFEDKDSAWHQAQILADNKQRVASFAVVEGESEDDGDVITLNDVPIQFGPQKRYRDRRVTL